MATLHSQLEHYRARTEQQLQQALSHSSIEPRLQDAMRYSLLNGGKRIRPLLVYLVNQLLDGDLAHADAPACAIEMIHSYSLIHDDLPAMDDDDLRRGQPTCHIAHGEAIAILAGDALHSLAFEQLSYSQLPPAQVVTMFSTLARAAGDRGMVAGQAYDLNHVDQPLDLHQLEQMHHHKTGALLHAAITLGRLSAAVDDPIINQALARYGAAIGLAFQVKDDILDIEADTATLGKPQGSDSRQNKPTYPGLLGLEAARNKLQQLHQHALSALAPLGQAAEPLRQLATYLFERTY